MSQAEHDRRIDYIEFPARDIEVAKRFYQTVFGWKFTDYGPGYSSFEDGRLTGGLRREELDLDEVRQTGFSVVPGEAIDVFGNGLMTIVQR